MKNHSVLLLTLAATLTAPLTAHAQSKPTHVKMAAAAMYECPICHHKVNAAQAKKLHYVCPDDHGKLVPAHKPRHPLTQNIVEPFTVRLY